jgi:hypothetical protein
MNTVLDPKVLMALESDMEDLRPSLLKLTRQVVSGKISRYPIYVAGHAPIAIGKPFLSAELSELHFDYNASVLEEFVSKGLVLRERLDDFRSAFGNPEEKACIFVAMPESSGFVFLPLNT